MRAPAPVTKQCVPPYAAFKHSPFSFAVPCPLLLAKFLAIIRTRGGIQGLQQRMAGFVAQRLDNYVQVFFGMHYKVSGKYLVK